MRQFLIFCVALFLVPIGSGSLRAQTQEPWTWERVREHFEQNNPTLLASRLSIDEAKAQEITAHLRPNPNLSLNGDQIDPFGGPPHGEFAYFEPLASVSYLFERDHKRGLRFESAQKATAIASATNDDLERTLLFSLRNAFVGTLQAKAVRDLAKDNLAYYDHVLQVSKDRFEAGDIAQIDYERLELQRVQYESDLQTAEVNLRTSKIQLLALLNNRTPIAQFDVSGTFDFSEQTPALEDVRQAALATRPDLKAAMQSVDKAKVDYKLAVANGSTDPTVSFDIGRNPPIDAFFGLGVSIPLRIFDRNQGEKKRTELDIDRNQKLYDGAQAQVFSDVDSAYETLRSNVILLEPYKRKYLQEAVHVRETVLFSYQHGGASLLDFLNAQSDYRTVELNYVNLVGSYLTAAAQLNMAVGREVIQ